MSRTAFCVWLKSIIVLSVSSVAEIAIPLFEITKYACGHDLNFNEIFGGMTVHTK